MGLPLPIKVYDLVSTVEMLQQSQERKERSGKKEAGKEMMQKRSWLTGRKALLMERNNMSEDEAHRYLQKSSMDSGTNLTETAQMILTILNE